MKRYGYLFDKFASVETAEEAIYKATQHKRNCKAVQRRFGYSHKVTAAQPELRGRLDPDKVHAEAEIISAMLRAGRWRPRPQRHITRRSPTTGKVREIDCPTLTDHIIHWMIVLTIKPAITRGMIDQTCASVPRRGTEAVRKYVSSWTGKSDAKYFAKLDIRKYYPNIDHDVLKSQLRRVIKDERMLAEIDKVIDTLPRGLAIGCYTSQWLSNFYLQGLDHHMTEDICKYRRGKRINSVSHYLRYNDDILIIGTSKRDLASAARECARYCRDVLRVEIKPEWEVRKIGEGKEGAAIDIGGYRFRAGAVTVRRRIFLHTARLARKIRRTRLTPRSAMAIVSLVGWFSHADSVAFGEKYIKPYIDIKQIRRYISAHQKQQSAAGKGSNINRRRKVYGAAVGRQLYRDVGAVT